MQPAATRVLKKNQINMSGPRRVGQAPASPVRPAAVGSARVVQQDERGAIIEIVCRCGETIRLRCSYDVSGPAGT